MIGELRTWPSTVTPVAAGPKRAILTYPPGFVGGGGGGGLWGPCQARPARHKSADLLKCSLSQFNSLQPLRTKTANDGFIPARTGRIVNG